MYFTLAEASNRCLRASNMIMTGGEDRRDHGIGCKVVEDDDVEWVEETSEVGADDEDECDDDDVELAK